MGSQGSRVSDDRRAVLEAIVYGSDSSIRPGERLADFRLASLRHGAHSNLGRSAQNEDGAGATGLEPATSGVTGRRSNQLNYAPEGRSVYLASQRSEDASSLRTSDQS